MTQPAAPRLMPLAAAMAHIAGLPGDDPAAWRPRRAAEMMAVIVAVLLVVGGLVGAFKPDDTQTAWASILGEAAIGVPVVLYARQAVRASGGWQIALGLDWPRWRDLRIGVGWLIVQYIARIVVGVALLDAIPAARHERVSNVPKLADKPWTYLLPLIITAVLVAPIVEELAFRGFLLRSLMRQWGFGIAAVINGVLFGLLHFEQAGGPAASIVLASTLAVFGYLQAVLVRRTVRLAPAMVVHSLNNALGVLIALRQH